MNPENALIYRRVVPMDDDRVAVLERWDLTHPDCPFVHNQWSSPIRACIMTKRQYAASRIPLKEEST
jgi:hypothetical protein